MFGTYNHNTNSTVPSESMKLTVLGANGNSGRLFVRQALEKGHRVTALVRDPAKMDIKHENLTIKQCKSVTRRENLTPHFKDRDAIVSCLGFLVPRIQMPWNRVTFLHDSMRAIVPAMRMAKVNRLVALSSWYLDTSAKDIPTFMKWVLMPFVYGKHIDDHYETEKYIERECQDIDYTLVRLPTLLDGPVTDLPIKVVDDGAMYVPDVDYITRADAARFTLSCLGTDKWNRKCPAVATH